jgi:probable O-glycosylation ligase (exosortase A-associated)
MTIPLIRYLHLQEKHRLVRLGLLAGMFLTAMAAVGSQSRGALVALLITGAAFWLKSRKKLATAIFVVIASVTVVTMMPQEWRDRMGTIKTYEEDPSALGRINAWWFAYNLASDRVTGGGFEAFQRSAFARYAPEPGRVHDAHSIYFEMLGEHGFIGLALFLTMLLFTWLKCSQVIRTSKRDPALTWARDLAAMIQVSLVAYMSAGAFLGLAYFDYVYHLVALVIMTAYVVKQTSPATVGAAKVPGPAILR